MNDYKAPEKEFLFLLKELIGYQAHAEVLQNDNGTLDVVESILPEAAKFFEQLVAPTNHQGDSQGSHLVEDKVCPPPVLDGVYSQLVEAGWCSLGGNTEYGGAGLPGVVNLAIQEMLQSANVGFSLLPMLTEGVVRALEKYATEPQKAAYLSKLVTGQWAGTMNLTEPQAGSDLAAIKTRAVPNGDHYLLQGQKIFITWGDHEYAENIIQLVLAKTPDAPEGTKGISMFIVPKFLINGDGSLGQRNDVKAVGVEHKLGIHSSPTCIMQYGDKGGAVGYLVGEENKGLMYMFAVMNAARLAVGHQGVSVSERAYQQAVAYAQDRVQGQVIGAEGPATIFYHPDVRRMLMQMKALTEAGRALSFVAQAAEDLSRNHPDAAVRAASELRVDVLTPLVKAWCTEAGMEVTSLGVQVHGGMGYIEETGAAQHYRDARILPIYEGTNGIQALDFIGRKTLRDGGEGVKALLDECKATLSVLSSEHKDQTYWHAELSQALGQCEEALQFVFANPSQSPALAFNYMMLWANTVCAWLMVKSAMAAAKQISGGDTDSFYPQKIATANFFLAQVLPRNHAYLAALKADFSEVMAMAEVDYIRQ